MPKCIHMWPQTIRFCVICVCVCNESVTCTVLRRIIPDVNIHIRLQVCSGQAVGAVLPVLSPVKMVTHCNVPCVAQFKYSVAGNTHTAEVFVCVYVSVAGSGVQ